MSQVFSVDNIRNYVIALLVFLAIDMVWLNVIAKSLYARYLGYLMTSRVNIAAAFAFYLLFIVGVLVFVVNPALARESWQYALSAGALFGLVCYATYDLTNLATVKDWPVLITVIDLIWGTTLSAATSVLSYLVIRLFR
jgi:uncharacterized membrane protein